MARWSLSPPKWAYSGSTFAHWYPRCIVKPDPAALYRKQMGSNATGWVKVRSRARKRAHLA
jgi:hypothetical protein